MKNMRIIVIKVGSSVIVKKSGRIDYNRISKIFNDIIDIDRDGYHVILITSGAVATGSTSSFSCGMTKKLKKQFFASIGQPKLMQFYSFIANQHGKSVAQLLLTRNDFDNREQYFAIKNTILMLLMNNHVPIINNNDILQNKNCTFRDNDHLAACIGGMMNADSVIFLSSTDGVYQYSFQETNHKLIELVKDKKAFDELYQYIRNEQSYNGTGGMKSKLNAIKLLFDLGIKSYIASGHLESGIDDILFRKVNCSYFEPQKSKKITGIRKWLTIGAIPSGKIYASIIGGNVLRRNRNRGSLLASGVKKISGFFIKGDVVSVYNEDNKLLGYGITEYNSSDILSIIGKKSIIIIHANYFYGFDNEYF